MVSSSMITKDRALHRGALLADGSFAHLVDEFFFEYHFIFDKGVVSSCLAGCPSPPDSVASVLMPAMCPQNFSWGMSGRRDILSTTPRGLMRRLRNAGIRAHFWIHSSARGLLCLVRVVRHHLSRSL